MTTSTKRELLAILIFIRSVLYVLASGQFMGLWFARGERLVEYHDGTGRRDVWWDAAIRNLGKGAI